MASPSSPPTDHSRTGHKRTPSIDDALLTNTNNASTTTTTITAPPPGSWRFARSTVVISPQNTNNGNNTGTSTQPKPPSAWNRKLDFSKSDTSSSIKSNANWKSWFLIYIAKQHFHTVVL